MRTNERWREVEAKERKRGERSEWREGKRGSRLFTRRERQRIAFVVLFVVAGISNFVKTTVANVTPHCQRKIR